MKKFHYVYLTTNLVNGKQYIGDHSTDNINDNYIGSGRPYFKNALKQYGKQNFKREILEFFTTKQEAFEAQQKYIKQYNTLYPNGYNLSPLGGNACPNGISKDGCKRISESKKGKNFSLKHKESLRLSHKGQIPWNKGKTKIYSENTIRKMREIKKGKKATEETRKKMSKSQIGKKLSENSRKKMSISAMNRKASKETKIILSNAHKGISPGNKNKKAIYKDGIKKYIIKDEISFYLEKNWKLHNES